MENENNLHLEKSSFEHVIPEAHDLHYRQLTSEEDQDKELNRCESKDESFLEFRKEVMERNVAWQKLICSQMQDQVHLNRLVLAPIQNTFSQFHFINTSERETEAS